MDRQWIVTNINANDDDNDNDDVYNEDNNEHKHLIYFINNYCLV